MNDYVKRKYRKQDGNCSICNKKYDKYHFQKNHQDIRNDKGCFVKGHPSVFKGITKKDINHPYYKSFMRAQRKRVKTMRKNGEWFGEKSPNWKGGICNPIVLIRGSEKYKIFVQNIFKRDNYTCQICGDRTGGNLQAHHIIPLRENLNIAFNNNNAITLCYPCHKPTLWHEQNYIKYFQEVMSYRND